MFKISKFSELTCMSVRTLQYYDEIGLLVPDREWNGHRVYSYNHLVIANEIKLLKEAGMTLEAIRRHFEKRENQGEMDLQTLLLYQKNLVQQHIEQLHQQLDKIDYLLSQSYDSQQLEEAVIKETFINHNPFKESIEAIWHLHTSKDWQYIKSFEEDIEFDKYFAKLATLQHLPIASPSVQQITAQFIAHLKKAYGSSLTQTGMQEIARLYQENSQAREYLAKYGQSFPQFLSEAMRSVLSCLYPLHD